MEAIIVNCFSKHNIARKVEKKNWPKLSTGWSIPITHLIIDTTVLSLPCFDFRWSAND